MCNKQNLPERVAKARAAARFAQILQLDGKDRPTIVLVPGSQGKQYVVKFYRGKEFEATCENVTGKYPVQCISHAKVACYHVLAATMVIAAEQNKSVVWGSSRADVVNLNNIHHGNVFAVKMRPTDYTMYGIAHQENDEQE